MTSLLLQLTRWRRRERLYRLTWGAARFLAVVLAALVAACLVDWSVDRERDTPFALRAGLTAAQLILSVWAARRFLLGLGVPTLDALAERAEESIPKVGHRLVTALQLGRPGARTDGMSRALIDQVTHEAELMSQPYRLHELADARPLRRGAGLLALALVPAGAVAATNPELVAALLARQALLNVEIPRPVTVTDVTPAVWPAGDEVELKFQVVGPVGDDASGTATVTPDDGPADRVTLWRRGDGSPAVFTATLPPGSTPLSVRARAAGGRTKQAKRVEFVPRPAVDSLAATLLLPAYVDPAGKRRFEKVQPQGEVYAHPDCSVALRVTASKPVASAAVELLTANPDGTERVAARVPMALAPDGKSAEATFDLPARASAYRVVLADDHGFTNLNPPRRGITLSPDAPPQVELLGEVLKDPRDDGPSDDYEVNGMPLAVGGQVQVGWRARSDLGVDAVYLVYRVNDGKWTPLPLARTQADPAKLGAFLPDLGVFEKSGLYGQVEFYPIPASNPDEPGGLDAGGRYNFQASALSKEVAGGTRAPLAAGDRVEFAVAAFDRKPGARAPLEPPAESGGEASTAKPAAMREPGWSARRSKVVVTPRGLQEWLEARDQSRQRLRDLEDAQRGVFRRPEGMR